jgi:hypothetical protein
MKQHEKSFTFYIILFSTHSLLFLSDHTPTRSAANNGKPEKPQAQNETRARESRSEGVNENPFFFSLSFLHAFSPLFLFLFWFVVCGFVE